MRSLSRAFLLRLAPAVAGALLLAPSLAAGVFVVDAAGGGDFTNLGQAVAAAVDGDILLVKPGNYGAGLLEIDGKALTIIGDTGGEALVPSIYVNALPAGETLVLRHLTIVPSTLTFLTGGTVTLQLSGGRVHIEDCVLEGLPGLAPTSTVAHPGLPGLRVAGAFGSAVAVHRSTLIGGEGVSTLPGPEPFGQIAGSAGGPAIRMEGGQLALYGVTATGGAGGSGAPTGVAGYGGGEGLQSTNSFVFVAGSLLTGGEGGSGSQAGQGGVGANIIGSIADLDTEYVGGSGALGLVLAFATRVHYPGEAWSLVTSAPVRSGELGTITATGPPNALFGLFFSAGMGYLHKASLQGPFLPASPFFGPLLVVATDESGQWSTPFVAPNLQTFGLEGLVHIDQALMVQESGLVLSNATAHVQVQPPN